MWIPSSQTIPLRSTFFSGTKTTLLQYPHIMAFANEFHFTVGCIIAAKVFTAKRRPSRTLALFFDRPGPFLSISCVSLNKFAGKNFPMDRPRNCFGSLWADRKFSFAAFISGRMQSVSSFSARSMLKESVSIFIFCKGDATSGALLLEKLKLRHKQGIFVQLLLTQILLHTNGGSQELVVWRNCYI